MRHRLPQPLLRMANPPGKGSPVGDPVLPLLGAALLAAGGVSIRRRKKKMLNNKINNN